ncbi:hypothetical protein N9R95_01075 [Flavobacteriaceae bacterium]|jgi:hypothetical protein|nr:hypothetical protein [Flavobacteriaceae bacterium]
MKKLLLFTTLFLAFACSKDDEGETFLDKYNGTSWTVNDSVEILTFSNGTYFYSQYFGGEASIEGNEEDTFECMQYKEGTNVIFGIELTYEILKNEADELLFEATLMGQKLGTMKFTTQGENLIMTETGDGTETTVLIKSNESYSDYCN